MNQGPGVSLVAMEMVLFSGLHPFHPGSSSRQIHEASSEEGPSGPLKAASLCTLWSWLKAHGTVCRCGRGSSSAAPRPRKAEAYKIVLKWEFTLPLPIIKTI